MASRMSVTLCSTAGRPSNSTCSLEPEENDAFLHALGTALTEAGMDLTTGRA